MAYFALFAILFALATVNNAQMEPLKLPFDLPQNPMGTLPSGPIGGGFGTLPGPGLGPAPSPLDRAGDIELQKIKVEGCEGMSHYVMGRQMRQSCSTYCGSSFMTGQCYSGACYCTPR